MHTDIQGSRALQLCRSAFCGLLATAIGCGVWAPQAIAKDQESAVNADRATQAPRAAAALILQRQPVDDEEGRAAQGAGLGSETDVSSDAASTDSAGLAEEPGSTEAGGVKVDLRGRFRTSLVLERRADGSTVEKCISNLPSADSGAR